MNLLRKLTNYRVALIAVGAAVVGGLLIFAEANTHGSLSFVCGGVGSTTLSIGLVVLAYELWLRRSLVAEFLEASNLSSDLAATGVLEIKSWQAIDWNHFLAASVEYEISFSYGRTWSAQYAERVIQAVHHARTRVTLIVLDPEGPEHLLEFYGQMYGTDAEGLRSRINESIGIWKDAANRVDNIRAGTVRVEGSVRQMPYTFYRAGDSMWIVLSPRQSGRGTDIPALFCKRGSSSTEPGLFEWVVSDIEGCRRNSSSRTIWSAT